MKIVHRCDGGAEIGLGHLIRNQSLARELQKRGHEVSFVTRRLDGSAEQCLRQEGCNIKILPDAATPEQQAQAMEGNDFAVVDSYEAAEGLYSSIRKNSKLLAFVDYELPFFLDVDALLIPHIDSEKFSFRLPANAIQLRGPEYFILREEFRDLSKRTHRDIPSDILVTFGGADVPNMTRHVACAIAEFEALTIHFVMGNSYSLARETELRAIAASAMYRSRFYRNVNHILDLMIQSDIAIAPPSTTAYELCAAGTPVLAIITGDDQRTCATGLRDRGAIELLGRHSDLSAPQIATALRRLLGDVGRRRMLAANSQSVTDGKGALRVADAIEKLGGMR